ncbi:MAG: polymer-forming cytoskeletal protein [Gammaproteobacteria bacterium]
MFGRKERGKGVIQTLIGDNTRIKGDLRFEGGCHIDGVVDGSVIADKDPEAFLSISEEGFVDGSVRVPRVQLNGKVQGDVFASEMVELGTTAKVNGNVHYELLEMAAGAEINGKLIHEGSQSQSANAPRPTAADKLKKEKADEGKPESVAAQTPAELPS